MKVILLPLLLFVACHCGPLDSLQHVANSTPKLHTPCFAEGNVSCEVDEATRLKCVCGAGSCSWQWSKACHCPGTDDCRQPDGGYIQ